MAFGLDSHLLISNIIELFLKLNGEFLRQPNEMMGVLKKLDRRFSEKIENFYKTSNIQTKKRILSNLVESLRRGITLLGKNPFIDFPKTKVFDVKKSIVDRMREYIYVLRKSYFDRQAERKFISRYDKIVLLSVFLLLDGFSYPEIFAVSKNDAEMKLKKKGYLMFADKKRNIEQIWIDIKKQY